MPTRNRPFHLLRLKHRKSILVSRHHIIRHCIDRGIMTSLRFISRFCLCRKSPTRIRISNHQFRRRHRRSYRRRPTNRTRRNLSNISNHVCILTLKICVCLRINFLCTPLSFANLPYIPSFSVRLTSPSINIAQLTRFLILNHFMQSRRLPLRLVNFINPFSKQIFRQIMAIQKVRQSQINMGRNATKKTPSSPVHFISEICIVSPKLIIFICRYYSGRAIWLLVL